MVAPKFMWKFVYVEQDCDINLIRYFSKNYRNILLKKTFIYRFSSGYKHWNKF